MTICRVSSQFLRSLVTRCSSAESARGVGARADAGERPAEHGGGGGRGELRLGLPAARAATRVARPALGQRLQVGRAAVAHPPGQSPNALISGVASFHLFEYEI